MTIHPSAISDAELCAFLDGEVSDARRAELTLLLRRHPALQAKLNLWRTQNSWLRAAFAARAQEPVPDTLLQALPSACAPALTHQHTLSSPMSMAASLDALTRADEAVAKWKKISLALGVLLLATALYASGLVAGTQNGAHVFMEKWTAQPRSLRGS